MICCNLGAESSLQALLDAKAASGLTFEELGKAIGRSEVAVYVIAHYIRPFQLN